MSEKRHSDNPSGRSSTVDCVDFWFDGPADTTRRPIPPERLEQAKAARDLIRQVEAERQANAKGIGQGS